MYPARRNTKFFDNISQKPISISEDFDSNNNLVEKEFNPAIESSDNKYLLTLPFQTFYHKRIIEIQFIW